MLSRRENLLVRPWQERRYRNHRRKVISATPAVDASPPPFWGHVCCKLKSSAKEEERTSRIERDNFRLLQRMGKIMRSSKKMVDDRWTGTAQPTFLNRVGIYVPTGKARKAASAEDVEEATDSQETGCPTMSTTTPRKHARCTACCPVAKKATEAIPEERVPWEPPRPSIGRRKSSPVRLRNRKECPEQGRRRRHPDRVQTEELIRLKNKAHYPRLNAYCLSFKMDPMVAIAAEQRRKDPSLRGNSFLVKRGLQRLVNISEPTEEVVLECGSLSLSIAFPPESEIRVKNVRGKTRYIQRGYCYCNAFNLRNDQNTGLVKK